MTSRHKPYRESRTIPVNPAEMQECVRRINLSMLSDYDHALNEQEIDDHNTFMMGL